MLHIPLLKHNGPTPVKWVVAFLFVVWVSVHVPQCDEWAGALDRREPSCGLQQCFRTSLPHLLHIPPPRCRSFGITVTRQRGLIWNFSCSSQVTGACKKNLKSVPLWKVGYTFFPPIKVRRAWFAKPCKAAGLLRLKFCNLGHPSCKSPVEGVFSFVLGFHNQLASF